jgi:hypothetical protein
MPAAPEMDDFDMARQKEQFVPSLNERMACYLERPVVRTHRERRLTTSAG